MAYSASGLHVHTLGDGTYYFNCASHPRCRLRNKYHKEYTIEPKFACKLGTGTAFVLDVWDDLFFTHVANFELVRLEASR